MNLKHSSTTFLIAALVSVSALAASCGGSSSNPTTPTPTPTPGADGLVTIFINGQSYSPNPLTVSVGQSVNWKNNDTIEHTATFDNGGYESGNIPPLSAHDNPVQMNTRGTFAFHCRIHAGMKGSIIVQ